SFTCSCWRNKCLWSQVQLRGACLQGTDYTSLLYFSLFTDTNKKGCDWNTGLELSLTGQIKITHNILGCPGQFGTVGNPTCTYVITYLSVLTLAITSASSRGMHRLTIKV